MVDSLIRYVVYRARLEGGPNLYFVFYLLQFRVQCGLQGVWPAANAISWPTCAVTHCVAPSNNEPIISGFNKDATGPTGQPQVYFDSQGCHISVY